MSGLRRGWAGYTEAMRLIADLHIHSRYSRATSPNMDLHGLARGARQKGVDLMGTGDFTHPRWAADLSADLLPVGDGLYTYGGVRFLYTAEVAAVWSHESRTRRVHFLLLAPDEDGARHIGRELAKIGRLDADGRPMLGISGEKLVDAVLSASPEAVIIPAHVWTPWYSVFGSRSGFDSMEEALGAGAQHVFALETGLSSDPPMNWRVSALDELALVSSSDAHSPSRIGREACVFDLPEPSYATLVAALRDRDPRRFRSTIEFFPEEGKYHHDGHRACGVAFSPRETAAHHGRCPACGRPVTIGVLHRVEELADRPTGSQPRAAIPHRSTVPLAEILAQVLGAGPETKAVQAECTRLAARFGSELAVLLDLPLEDLAPATSPRVVEAIAQVRVGNLVLRPGYDGQYGEIRIPLKEEHRESSLCS